MNIAILGAGAWGTALAISFANAHRVTLWARDPEQAALLAARRENQRYLPGVPLPSAVGVSTHFADVLARADVAIIAVPLAGLRAALRALAQASWRRPFLWLCKGLEPGSGLLAHQVAAEELPKPPCGLLTGPSFAEEVARGLPAAVALASSDPAFCRTMVQALSGQRLRIYANDDLIGAEVAGAVKNVLAIASGISDGLGLGFNARAALITRGLAEITRFGVAMGGSQQTFMGLAGLGDVVLTCTGDLSRNRRVGLELAAGKPLATITGELGHVAEGVPSAREVALRARALDIDMPITQAVCAVLDGRLAASEAVAQLMARDPKIE